MELKELLESVVGREALDPVVGDPVLRTTLGAFDLRAHVSPSDHSHKTMSAVWLDRQVDCPFYLSPVS